MGWISSRLKADFINVLVKAETCSQGLYLTTMQMLKKEPNPPGRSTIGPIPNLA